MVKSNLTLVIKLIITFKKNNMKNYITIIALLISSFSCIAQQYNNIVPLEDYYSYGEGKEQVPQGTYFKDINNVLNKYVGTWKGMFEGRNYTLKIQKSSDSSKIMKTDILYIRYSIKEADGTILEKTIDDTNASALPGSLFVKDKPNTYWLLYWGKDEQEIECGNVGDMFIETFENNNKLKMYVQPEAMVFWKHEGEPDPCPNGRVLPPFPEEDEAMILTKQNTIRPLKGATKE